MQYVYSMYAVCMPNMCSKVTGMYAVCIQHVRCMYAACMLYTCSMYTACMLYVCGMYAACMLYVWSMYAVCMQYIYTVYMLNIKVTCMHAAYIHCFKYTEAKKRLILIPEVDFLFKTV